MEAPAAIKPEKKKKKAPIANQVPESANLPPIMTKTNLVIDSGFDSD